VPKATKAPFGSFVSAPRRENAKKDSNVSGSSVDFHSPPGLPYFYPIATFYIYLYEWLVKHHIRDIYLPI
jgi:hypothetical protein